MFLTGLVKGSNWGGDWGDLLEICASIIVLGAIAELLFDW